MFWGRVQGGAVAPTEGNTPLPLIANVQFGATPATVVASETVETPVTITILRTGRLASECSVQWAATGTADEDDYVLLQPLSGRVLFPASATAAVITLTLRPAAASTPDKLIIITLSGASNCEISGGTSRSINVDMPGLGEPGEEYPEPVRTLKVTNRSDLVTVLTQTTGTFPASIDIIGPNRNAPLHGLDRVICADGDYTGDYTPTTSISTTAGPIVIYSENLHGARFLGRLTLNREKMWAARLDFDGAGLETSAGLTMTARYCRAHRCRFHGVESSSTADGRIIVSVTAADCQLYYCLWDDNDARLVSGKAEDIARLHLYRCYLKNSRSETASAASRECVQLGQTQSGGDGLTGSLSPVHTTVNALVEFCLFENLLQSGGDENEVVSIKSSGNTVRQCTFVDSQYCFVRSGNDNRLESNWFEAVSGTKNRGIGVRGDRNVLIGNKLGTGTTLRVYGGNEDMSCARWDHATAGNFGSPRYMKPRTAEPTWPVVYSRPWSGTSRFDATGNASSSGTVNPDFAIARDSWLVANDGALDIGVTNGDGNNYWQARNSKVRAHVGAIKTESAYPSWANVPTATTGYRETGSTYSGTVEARFLPLPTAATRLLPSEVGPGAIWQAPTSVVPPAPVHWWRKTVRSGRAWAAGVSYWYDRAPTGPPTTPTGWPYPQSPLYQKLNFNGAIHTPRYAEGGDQFPVSEDGSNGLLFVSNDGTGWNGASTKTGWRVLRCTGTPPDGLSGTDTAMTNGASLNPKSMGVLAFNTDNIAVWYTFKSADVARHGDTFVALSDDGGASVTLHSAAGDEIFRYRRNEDFVACGTLQLGANYAAAGGVDNDYIYVYVGLQAQQSVEGYADGTGNHTIWLTRVKWKGTGGVVANIYDRSKYAILTGYNATTGATTWGAVGDFTATKLAVYADGNGISVYFNVFWHSAINKFVATYAHAGIGSANQGIAVAISDSPWNPDGWTMIGYVQDLDHAEPDETNWYLNVGAPSRWNDGSTMHFAINTYVEGASGGSGDNLIVTPVTLSAPANSSGITAAQEYANEELDVAFIDAATGSSTGDAGGNQTNVATWDGVIGGAEGSAMDTSDTQFDWTSADLRFAFDDVVANLPAGGGWLIWAAILIPDSSSTAVEADFAVWDEITAGTHDSKYKKFGERVVRRMALTAHPLDRLIIDVNPEMNLANTYRVFASTRTKYKNAMIRAINMIRQGAEDYLAGSSDDLHFLHRPSYSGDIGDLISYCPDNVDCVGLTWRPGLDASSAAELATLMNGLASNTYGVATDLLALSDALGVPICFPQWGPRFESGSASPIADIVAEKFYDFLASISDRLVGECVFHQNVRDTNGFEGTSPTGDAAWQRMVPLRKALWSGQKTPIQSVDHLPEDPVAKRASYTGDTYYVSASVATGIGTPNSIGDPGNFAATLHGINDGSTIIVLAGAYGALDTTPKTGQIGRLRILARNPVFTDLDMDYDGGMIGFDPGDANLHSRITGHVILRNFSEVWVEGFRLGDTNLTGVVTTSGKITIGADARDSSRYSWYVKNYHKDGVRTGGAGWSGKRRGVHWKNFHLGRAVESNGLWQTDYHIYMDPGLINMYVVGNFIRGGHNQAVSAHQKINTVRIHDNTFDSVYERALDDHTGGTQLFLGQSADNPSNPSQVDQAYVTHNKFRKVGDGKSIQMCNLTNGTVEFNEFTNPGASTYAIKFDSNVGNLEPGAPDPVVIPPHPDTWTFQNNTFLTPAKFKVSFGSTHVKTTVQRTKVIIRNNISTANLASTFDPDGGIKGGADYQQNAPLLVTFGTNSKVNKPASGIEVAPGSGMDYDDIAASFINVYPMAVDSPGGKSVVVPSFAVNTGNSYSVPANTIYDLRGKTATVHEDANSATSYTINAAAATSVVCGGKSTSSNSHYFGDKNAWSWAQAHGNTSTGSGASGNYPAIRITDFTSGFKMQGFYCRRTMDGVSANDWGNTGTDPFVLENGCLIEMRDDAISNDGQGAAIYRNVYFQGHVWLSWAPGDPGDPGPPGGSPDPKRGTICTFENCLIDMDRMLWIGEDTDGVPGCRRADKYISATQRNNTIIGANIAGMAHQSPIKGPTTTDSGGMNARLIIKNSIMRISSLPVNRLDDILFPKLGDGVGAGSNHGSYYENFYVCWLGPPPDGTGYGPWPWPNQNKSDLAAMGITLIDDETDANALWNTAKTAWYDANDYDSGTDTFAWNRP